MNTNEVLQLIKTLTETGYKHIDVTHEGSHILLSNSDFAGMNNAVSAAPAIPAAPVIPVVTPAVPVAQASSAVNDEITQAESVDSPAVKGGHLVESPIVGTFYEAVSPDADPFVKVGSKVKKGDVLCIIEAMKLMNEIEAEISGKIVKVLAENAQPVEFNQPLFLVEKS